MPGCREAAALLNFGAEAAVPAPPPTGHTLTEAELQPFLQSLTAVRCCSMAGAAVLNSLSPAVCEQLGSSTTYRVAAACSWAYGETAVAIVRTAAAAAQACGANPWADGLWRELLSAVQGMSNMAWLVLCIGWGKGGSSPPPPHARLVLTTLCKQERVLCLLDAVTEVVMAAGEAAGALLRLLSAWRGAALTGSHRACLQVL